jgi:glycosyltransferase A (GT-A) superfamily protein (DUF2064 family)
MHSNHHASLVVLIKRPKLYQGKQRLAASIGAKSALIIAQRLLACVIDDANHWPGQVILAPSSTEDCEWAKTLLSRPALVLPQPEGNLGQRLQHIDQQLTEQAITSRIYIGSDAPCLDLTLLLHVNHLLTLTDVVLSNARDGGVTVMATNNLWPILTELPWSTALFSQQLTRLCAAHELQVRLVTDSYDIDNEADIDFAYQDLAGDNRPSRQYLRQAIHWIKIEKDIVHA